MVNGMVEAVMNPNNKKIAYITFKIVEETIKRACLRTEIENYSFSGQDQLNNMKAFMSQSFKYKNEWKKTTFGDAMNITSYISNNST
jgi:hypothetical protein